MKRPELIKRIKELCRLPNPHKHTQSFTKQELEKIYIELTEIRNSDDTQESKNI